MAGESPRADIRSHRGADSAAIHKTNQGESAMSKSIRLSCLAAGLLAIYAGDAPADPNGQVIKSTIEGPWETVMTLRVSAPDCTTAAVYPFGTNPFASLYTFHEGGTLSEWGTRSPPSMRTSGQGLWKRTANDEFKYRLKFYSFDANGFMVARMEIASDLKLARDGLSLEGVSRLVRTDLSGNVQNFCATVVGTRMSL